jgi:hypothetical protein
MNTMMRSLFFLSFPLLTTLTTPVLADVNEIMSKYPPPPPGIQWGWQGEVLFKFDSAAIRAADKPFLNDIATTLKNEPDVSVLITGHTDNTGDLSYNRQLSNKRVKALINYFVSKKIGKNRIASQSTGEQRPVSSDACSEDRERNRRADIAFFPTGETPPLSEPVHGESKPEAGECEELKAREREAR